MLVIGKTIGGGIPVGGVRHVGEVADRIARPIRTDRRRRVGGTAGYALSLAAARAALGEVLTAAFERMIPLAERWEAGVNAHAWSMPWRAGSGQGPKVPFVADPPGTAPSRGLMPIPYSALPPPGL